MNIESFKAVAQDALAGATKYINTHHVGQVFCATQAVIGTALTISALVFGSEIKDKDGAVRQSRLVPAAAGLIFTGLNVYGTINPLAGVIVPIIDFCIAINSKSARIVLLSAGLAAGLSFGVRGDLSGFNFSQLF